MCGETLRTIFIYIWLEVSAISTKELQINEEIRAKEVRIVGEGGEQVGVMSTSAALSMAYEKDLDLVLIAPNAQPPVCRIMDYGKYRFERDKKEKEAKKKQTVVEVKEIQLSCNIDTHDFETKVKHAHRFIGDGNKVRVVVKFRGREMSHLDIGRDLLARFEEAVSDAGTVEKRPSLEGRFMSMISKSDKAARQVIIALPYFGLAAYPNYTSAMGAINEGVIKMGKIKTHKATAKRFSLTKNGKVKLNHTNRRHKLGHKTAKRKRQLRVRRLPQHVDGSGCQDSARRISPAAVTDSHYTE